MSDQIENQTEIELRKAKRKEYQKKYTEKNKTKVLEKAREKKLCTGCAKLYSYSNFSKHIKDGLCITVYDQEQAKKQKKIKKIQELNEYITRMNNLYETDVKLIEIPQ